MPVKPPREKANVRRGKRKARDYGDFSSKVSKKKKIAWEIKRA